uniref:Zinc finger, CCHC-type n=1 Tax=Tanacetum cinerariifolium TaxID=118510 RepID=A0A6L2LA85_TANCI|nr:zinc finger, CCHC-type [Tanacetum cinerariifolium]
MQDMSKDELILAFDMDTEKCNTCILTKTTKKPFQTIKHETEVLELIHNDLVPNKKNRITPYELWTKRKPNLNYLRVWACRAVVRLPYPKLKTLGERGIEGIFVRYVDHSKAFRFFVIEPNESVSINSIIESRDAIFDKNRFSSGPRPSLRIQNGTKDIGGSVVPEEVTEEKEAINDEMDSIIGNNTRVLDDLPPGCKPLCYKWIFKRKLKVDGTTKKFKASTIRLLIAMASIHNLIIHQIDVKIAFLNVDLDEEVDMTKEFLSSRFSVKDMGEAYVILGIRIKYKSNGIEISQSHYIEKASKKQTCITSSIMESEFVALAVAGKEAEWLKNFLLEISLWSKPAAPISIRCDSAATLVKAYFHIYNGKSRHLGVRHSMIRELITNRVISIEFVRSQQNLDDHLTKRLARDLVIKSAKGMGLKSN